MKVFHAALFARPQNCRLLASAKDLSSFGYFQRGSVGEFMEFFSKTLADRTAEGARQSVQEQEYVVHVHARHDGITCTVITDKEYPGRVAFSFLSKVVAEFQKKYPQEAWGEKGELPFPELEQLLIKYQTPEDADPMMKIQKDLDDTKVVLHNTLESALKRGEKLEDLVVKSDELSASSKMFYKTAKKQNSCCVIS
eukprot:m.320106 g.320106  ORF g.320106 m.320106 type:complete len:196 (+) comp23770_c0_seq1:206-793(+)